ncbi:MAG: DUF1489 domain-containing protein [Pseudomonadota bacterium]
MMHLIKLCVGADSVDDLRDWIDYRTAQRRANGLPGEQFHTTRMYPKQAENIIGKGSLYWVIKGRVQCRQPVVDIRPFVDAEGIKRCNIVLEPVTILTRQVPKRPFQGWRYLKPGEAPADLAGVSDGEEEFPAHMRAELAELGLL